MFTINWRSAGLSCVFQLRFGGLPLRYFALAPSIQMEGYGGPGQPSPTIAQCLNGGYGWLEVMCHRCETRASIPLDAIRRPRDTPIWKLEAALKCRSCKKGRNAPPVHMIKLTNEPKIAPACDVVGAAGAAGKLGRLLD